MSEFLLKALMQLFALLTNSKQSSVASGRAKVVDFLSEQFETEYVHKYSHLYETYVNKYHHAVNIYDGTDKEFNLRQHIELLRNICTDINSEIDLKEKTLLLSVMLNYIGRADISETEENFTDRLAESLRIPPQDYWNLKTFTLSDPQNVVAKDRLLIINGSPAKTSPDIKHIYIDKLGVDVWVLHICSTNTFVYKYFGERNLYMNGHKMDADNVYPLEPGAVINTSHVRPIYHGNVVEKFITRQDSGRIIYHAVDAAYTFADGTVGIHPFSFEGKSGQLVGIMGGSGAGKTTLMSLLCGQRRPSSGRITINGYDLSEEKEQLRGVIGYVPQEDMLNEELTVYENLWYNARLIFSDKSNSEKAALCEKALNDFDLVEARNLRVGTPINKIISGGQRKRLNIALELMREPSVLFVDEPTSGLSSSDSEKVMSLLKRQVLKGKLVVINIHQPGSDIYKLLDKLLIIDQGGYMVYNGNPMNAIVYFKKKAHYVNPEERECYQCGNVKTEQPLRIIETRMVDPSGKVIRKRKVNPQEWYKDYVEEFENTFDWKKRRNQREDLPRNLYSIPPRRSQILTYIKRDALKKIKDTQYLLLNLLEVPVLALLLSLATRQISDSGVYSLWTNDNLPTYLFMCVVVAIFMGLNVSAEEIIKDRQLLMRESFLNLSRTAYLDAKITNLLIISLVQTLLLVLIGHNILGIGGSWLTHSAILFTTYAWAVIFGLNISSGLKSQVAIYVSIPLVLVPQLLFSGTMVDFSKLHPAIGNRSYVPVIGDIMTSRWAYEALSVSQYMDNDYERNFYEAEKRRSDASYAVNSWLPEIKNARLRGNVELADSEIRKLCQQMGLSQSASAEQYEKILEKCRHAYDVANADCDRIATEMSTRLGGATALTNYKHSLANEALSHLVRRQDDLRQIAVYPDKMVRLRQPIYQTPDCSFGRAHFYAPYKLLGNIAIPTPIFNCIIIWLMIVVFYVTLYFDVLRKLLDKVESFNRQRANRRIERIKEKMLG